MAFILAGAIVAGATGLVKVGVGVSQKNKAKKRQADAKIQMDKDKDAYMNAPITNPYDNMENTMEDLTVNTQGAEFAAQKSEQARADIMGSMAGTAGASGIAALAQTMANTANQEDLKRDRMATQLGMSQSEYGAESQNVADAQAAIMSGIGDIGGAAGSFIGAGGVGGKKTDPTELTTREKFDKGKKVEYIDGKWVNV